MFVDRKKIEWNKDSTEENDSTQPRFNILRTIFGYREAFPDVYKLYAAIETFGCSTAVCEASFSASAQIDVTSRLSMTIECMRNLSSKAFLLAF